MVEFSPPIESLTSESVAVYAEQKLGLSHFRIIPTTPSTG